MSADLDRQRDFWRQQLAGVAPPFELPLDQPRSPAPSFFRDTVSLAVAPERWARVCALAAACSVDPFTVALAAYALVVSHYTGRDDVWIGSAAEGSASPNLVGVRIAVPADGTVGAYLAGAQAALHASADHRDVPFASVAAMVGAHPLFRTLVLPSGVRCPLWSHPRPPEAAALGAHAASCDLVLTVEAAPEGATLHAEYDPELFVPATLERLLGRVEVVMTGMAERPDARLSAVPVVTGEERARLIYAWNATEVAYDREACVHALIEAQAERTPQDIALVFAGEELTYAELDARANRLAHLLISRGVGPDVPVGVCIERSPAMVIAVLAVLKAGGAYIPMDPGYPAQRIAYMIKDSRVRWVLADHDVEGGAAEILRVDRALEAAFPIERPGPRASSSALAYIIYTSGSTGSPNGVMVEHRNVVNFFAGMDQRLGTTPGVWLAVTSLSFDISVLELLWTLSRGFRVVLFSARAAHRVPSRGARERPRAPGLAATMDFGLFYFASDEGDYAEVTGREKYRLLLDGARYADEHGFNAVWTPERHFHTFGGLYPSPAVAAGAIAVTTERVGIRAGSVVLPLHNPVRVAEEWALVDNLSDGRVAISFASGWQPQDFAIAPEAYADRHQRMFDGIATVRALWRGEPRVLPGGDGAPVSVTTRPRPVQAELPVWVTAGGSPETFRRAGEIGANVLTHLLGQSVEQLADRIGIYRRSYQEHGHVSADGRGGRVALMLHTFVSHDEATVRAAAHGPLKSYLRGAVGLFSPVAQSMGLDVNNLSPEDLDALAEHAFERYFTASGLFGTPESCVPMVERLRALGVDELACLIDFGIPATAVLANLPYLDELRRRFAGQPTERDGALATEPVPMGGAPPYPPAQPAADLSIGGLIRAHGVTHLQCTPSMASMLLGDPEQAAALGSLQRMMVGGEALTEQLAAALRAAIPGGVITNMYGPTETTIWSTTHEVGPEAGPVPIGRPIANTQVYLLGPGLHPVPAGMIGDLYIGGDGVARGYHDRPELTRARFVDDPFFGHEGGSPVHARGLRPAEPGSAPEPPAARRMYRTGDLGRYREGGAIEFLGRADHQVKLRGYRIELGEIEAALRRHPSVAEAVAMVREDSRPVHDPPHPPGSPGKPGSAPMPPDDKRLVAYLVARPGHVVPLDDLRAELRATLADYMVPAALVTVPRFPLTPNGKIDRNALRASAPEAEVTAPAELPPGAQADDLESAIAALWSEVLRVPSVGPRDNFFDLGGHSLLVAHVMNRLRSLTHKEIGMTDMFRYPTVESLAGFLRGGDAPEPALGRGQDRAARRRERMRR